MKLLYFGDVVGKPGRAALTRLVPELRKQYAVDLVLANIENSAHGFGFSPEVVAELEACGVDLFSTGNHAWKNGEGVRMLEKNPKQVVVPENYLDPLPGRGYTELEVNGTKVVLLNLIGEVFMEGRTQSPFRTFDRILEKVGPEALMLVDFHAEATGEKRVMSWYIDGRASLLVGTHTHVPTADAHIMPLGLAYVTDLGMCGATESSLGMNKDLALKKVADELDVRLEPPTEPTTVTACGILVDIDEGTKLATKIERIDREVTL